MEEDGKYTLAYDGNAINDGDQVAGVPDGGEIKYVSGQVAVLDTEEPTYTLAPATDDSAVIPSPTDEPETPQVRKSPQRANLPQPILLRNPSLPRRAIPP